MYHTTSRPALQMSNVFPQSLFVPRQNYFCICCHAFRATYFLRFRQKTLGVELVEETSTKRRGKIRHDKPKCTKNWDVLDLWEMKRVVPASWHFPGDNDHKRAATFLDKVDFRVLRKDRNVCGFCYRVRRARKDGRKFGTAKLNKHRIASLDPIGFDWEMQEVVPASGTLTGPLNPRLLARGI